MTRALSHVVIIRLSALGDVCNTLPAAQALARALAPQGRVHWVLAPLEAELLRGVPGIELIPFNKKRFWRSWLEVRRRFRGKTVDAVLHMQASYRATLLGRAITTGVRVGFDRERAKDFQHLFCSHHIAPNPRAHMVESFMDFVRALDLPADEPTWDLPVDDLDATLFPHGSIPPFVVISPCASRPIRNWRAESYARVADHVAGLGMTPVLSGGPSPGEQAMGQAIEHHAREPVLNLIGRTPIRQLAALLARARLLIAPDSGPSHLANALGTPVLGLYANTNPRRCGPYRFLHYAVNRFPEALMKHTGKSQDDVPLKTRVRVPGIMDLVQVKDVIDMVEHILRETEGQR